MAGILFINQELNKGMASAGPGVHDKSGRPRGSTLVFGSVPPMNFGHAHSKCHMHR